MSESGPSTSAPALDAELEELQRHYENLKDEHVALPDGTRVQMFCSYSASLSHVVVTSIRLRWLSPFAKAALRTPCTSSVAIVSAVARAPPIVFGQSPGL